MWLINTTSFELEEFLPEQCPPYAILSHRWRSQEVSFRDMGNLHEARRKQGFDKIRQTCKQANKDNLRYAWVDTCCINKESSAELSEAINSMFQWYRNADICYVYLFDVHQHPYEYGEFSKSGWFERGWTLQELIAPRTLRFYNSTWNWVGNRNEMLTELHEITGIDEAALNGADLSSFRVVTKMSWASRRATTRREDVAYSLLGIFDVNIPLLYGEGDKAFIRLQEEIIRHSDDGSIFGWRSEEPGLSGLLASSPSQFRGIASLMAHDTLDQPPCDIVSTNKGLSLSVFASVQSPGLYRVSTGCYDVNTGQYITIYLHRPVSYYFMSVDADSIFRRIHIPNCGSTYAMNQDVWSGTLKEWPKRTLLRTVGPVPLKLLVPQHKQHLFRNVTQNADYPASLEGRKLALFVGPKGDSHSFEPCIPSIEHTETKLFKGTNEFAISTIKDEATNEPKAYDKYTISIGYYGLLLSHSCDHPGIGNISFGFIFYGIPILVATTKMPEDSPEALRRNSMINSLITGKPDDELDWSVNLSERSIHHSQRVWRSISKQMRVIPSGGTQKTRYYPNEGGLWVIQCDLTKSLSFELTLESSTSIIHCLIYPLQGTENLSIVIETDLRKS